MDKTQKKDFFSDFLKLSALMLFLAICVFVGYLISSNKVSVSYSPPFSLEQVALEAKLLADKNAPKVFTAADGTKIIHQAQTGDASKSLTAEERLQVAGLAKAERTFFGKDVGVFSASAFNEILMSLSISLTIYCLLGFAAVELLDEGKPSKAFGTIILSFAWAAYVSYWFKLSGNFDLNQVNYGLSVLGLALGSLTHPIYGLLMRLFGLEAKAAQA